MHHPDSAWPDSARRHQDSVWRHQEGAMGSGHLLLQASRRAVRGGRSGVAVVVRLSCLSPPSPRPHHRRIARAMMQDVAIRHEGQVFALGGGDLILLCHPQTPDDFPGEAPPGSSRGASARRAQPHAAHPRALHQVLVQLLRADIADFEPERIVTIWHLPAAAPALIAYAESHAADRNAAPLEPPGPIGQPSRVDALAQAAETANLADLLERATAILLRPDAGTVLRPLFREVSFSIPSLDARVGPGLSAREDPYLFRHLAARLDRLMLAAVATTLGGGGPLDARHASAPPLHLNLALATASGPAMRDIAAALGGRRGPGFGVEIPLVDAAADPHALARAHRHLADAGCTLVIDEVTPAALALVDLAILGDVQVKLQWTAAIARLPADEAGALDGAIARLDPARIILDQADTEAALRWGFSRGIRRFQGAHVDALLSGARLDACAHAKGCTPRQCRERHVAVSAAGRRGCHSHDLLDRAAAALALRASPDPARRRA